MTNLSRGFTLVELLIVLAIIGILSAVVLASLTATRGKGNDVAVKGNISTIQTQAEIYYVGAGNNSYGAPQTGITGSCAAGMWGNDGTIKQAVKALTSVFAGEVEATDYKCISAAQTFVFAARLTNSNQFWCVDNTGIVKLTSTNALPNTSATVCP